MVNPDDEVTKTELRVQFKVSRTISGSPNEGEVTIYNLNESHRNAVGKELERLQLEAGYQPPEGGGNVSIIGAGNIRDVLHDKQGPDILTKITFGDGDKANRKGAISKTYPTGTPVPDVVQGIYEKFSEHDIAKGEWKFPDDIRTLKRPYSICGSCAREMNVLGRGNNFYWSIQNETMEVIPGDGFLPGVVLISGETGMIGAPTITDNGVKVKCLLNPAIRPNRQVEVQSQVLEMNAADGLYRVSSVDFDGDNQEGSSNFTATVHGEKINGEQVDEGVN